MLGRDLEALIERARGFKKELGDDFVSVEHLVLGFCADKRFGEKALREMGASLETVQKAVNDIRGSQKVTDQRECLWPAVALRIKLTVSSTRWNDPREGNTAGKCSKAIVLPSP